MSLTSQVKHSHQYKKYPFNQVYICCELNNAQFNNILKKRTFNFILALYLMRKISRLQDFYIYLLFKWQVVHCLV